MPEASGEALVERIRSGDPRWIGRSISLIEDGGRPAEELVRSLYPFTGGAATVGVTGPPGVGKSTLVSALVRRARAAGETVGVISVDPSSSLSRGALLGDRIRLGEHALDPGVFIRSMATRGRMGGVAEATRFAALVLDVAGKDLVITETVGVGQGEVGIAPLSDTVLLVLMPGAGDSIQALKAGIMEIPDVVVVNKSDHPRAATTAGEVQAVLALAPARPWAVPVVLTDAVHGDGLDDLDRVLADHRRFLREEGRLEARRAAGARAQAVALAAGWAVERIERMGSDDPALRALLDRVEGGEVDPLSAADELFDRVLGGGRPR